VLPRPESQSFTRFLVSTGAFLCLAAFLGPALVLRETDVLRVDTRELSALTSTGRAEVERRQHVARTAGEIAPYAGAVLLVGGIALLIVAVPRLRRQERADEARSEAELLHLQAAIEPQSEEEREEALEADARGDAGAPTDADLADAAERDEPTRAALRRQPNLRARMDRAREVEERVLRRIDELTPARYELARNVKLGGARRRLLLDGLLVSSSEELPDLLVEIKFTTVSVRNSLTNRLDEAIAKVVRYRRQVGRAAQAWLIVVTEEAVPREDLAWARGLARDLSGDVVLSVVAEDDIEQLRSPLGDLS